MAAPGQRIDVGGFALHIHCMGHGRPAVIFDAALGGSSLSWTLVQPVVAGWTTACTYDRAGFGWSDAGPRPRTAGTIATELRVLLERAGVPPPFVLVGHSFGTLVLRLFAARHAADVAGMVLVEPAFPEDWIEPSVRERRRMRRAIRLCRYGSVASRLRITPAVASVAGGAGGLARAAATFVSRRAFQREHDELLSPIAKLPPEARAALTRMWTSRAFYEALGSQIASIHQSAREVLDAGERLDTMPLAVVSATTPHPHHVKMQQRLVESSSRGRRLVAAASGHWVPLDDPATVISAIRGVWEEG